MSNWKIKFLSISIVLASVVVGCSDGDTMTKEQEEAARKPTANPNYKGPDPAAMSRMNQEMANYQEKHKNDKIEFNTK